MDAEFNPHDEFFCTILKKRMPYYDCKFEIENENEKCAGCITGMDNLILIKDYERQESEKPHKKRGRPSKDKRKLTVMEGKPEEPIRTEKEVKDLIPYEEKAMQIHIDFTQHSQLYGRIKQLAKRDYRDIDKQIMYMLDTWIDIDKKYEQAKKSAITKGLVKLNGRT